MKEYKGGEFKLLKCPSWGTISPPTPQAVVLDLTAVLTTVEARYRFFQGQISSLFMFTVIQSLDAPLYCHDEVLVMREAQN